MSDEESLEIENRLMRSDQPRGFPTVAQVVGVWREKFEEGLLNDSHFKEHWRLYVPRVLSLDPNSSCLENVFDEENVQNILFAPLEEFIFGGNPIEVFERIKRLDDPPSVCGRVFKLSEPTYNCRDCGTDPTCVLCVDCFKKSEHRNHKYKMAISNGGGCCDCGDIEAWKNHPYCSIHIEGTLVRSNKDSLFPEDLQKRTRIAFRAVLQYAYQLLSIDHEPKLPVDLCLKEVEDDSLSLLSESDTYCTVLYNDETHTFDHVINTLTKVIKCSQKDAIDYVTNIDREGRAVVKCASFQYCTELKSEVERFTGRSTAHPLKVQVKHSHVIAHQLFALKLLSWFQKILAHSKTFRQIFSEVVLETRQKQSNDISILEGILVRDSMLWKSARVHWHTLFISGMLKEYDSKKAFATVFTKHYGTIMKEFIRDDHDHSVSIAALAVQIYTVPTIAHFLIAKKDVLFVLLNTFWSECGSFLKDNKLEFQRNEHGLGQTFKRAQFIIYDLHYLLSSVPEEWTPELRKGFVDGLFLFLKLLSAMQGMDSVTRQVGQHMEYEPEWETAFNLHIKLSSVITSMIKWCGSDRTVLIKSYRATLKKLYENPCSGLNEPGVIREIADHSTTCINYDVSEKPVSIHLPLSRFLAGLYVRLEKHGLQFYSSEFSSLRKQTPEQIIEPVLRTQVMIAQVHAGLWRRNGYSILHQIYFYHNVKCRNEMLNKDIILLQFGASLIESNDFLIHLLNKFKLMEWADPDFENSVKRGEDDSLRQTIMLIEEFLALLITIVSERYVVGVGKVTEKECIKKEIIQQLCIKPLSHSELSKSLPENDIHNTNIDSIVEEVATFQKPMANTGKGLYKLKPEYYDQYNVFFYHYTKEELSKSEEAQRKRRKEESSLDCCPPPALPPFTDVFAPMLVNLLQCDVMFYIIQLVLKRACDLHARSFSESQLHRVLYLIGFALHEEQSRNCDYFLFTERCEKWEIFKYMKDLHKNPRVEAYRDLIKWTITKFKQVSVATFTLRAKKDAATTASPKTGEENMEVEESVATTETTVNEEDMSEDHMKKEKERIAKLAAERRLKIMAEMSSAQKIFMEENAKLYEEAKTVDKLKDDDMNGKNIQNVEFPIALGREQTVRVNNDPTYTCILCQEHQVVKSDAPAMVFGAFIQKSSVLKNDLISPVQSMKPKELYFLQSSLTPDIFVSICGHVMHSTCFQKYFLNLSTKESRRTYRLRQPISFDIEKEEFLCPLCESLNNSILPVLPPLSNITGASKPLIDEQITFENWLTSILKATEKKQQEIAKQKCVSTDSKRLKKIKKHGDCNLFETVFDDIESLDQDSMDTVETFLTTDDNQSEQDMSVSSGMVWDDEESNSSDVVVTTQTTVESKSNKPKEDMEIVLVTEENEAMNFTSVIDLNHKPVISDSVRNMITSYTKSVCTKGLDESDLDENRSILFCWKSCAYTIHVVEALLRNENRSLLGDLPTRQKKCIKSLIRLSTMQEICKNQRIVNSYALMLLSLIFDCNYDFKNACILDWDPFGMLVSLVMSLPSLFFMYTPAPFPNGSVLDLYVTKLMLIATISQVLIGVDTEQDDLNINYEENEKPEEDDTECLRWYLRILNRADSETINTSCLWKCIMNSTLSFLRCSCIFFRYLTGIHPPDCLKQISGDTYENMCRYLGLPTTCKELLDNETAKKVFKKWAKKWQKCQQGQKMPLKFETYFNHRGLITLPKDYSELINSVSLFTCPNSDHEDSRNPTLCLVCGTMLCSQSYCCQKDLQGNMVGACAHHTYTCGAGAGIFLRIRECEILLLSCPNRGCLLPPPYLDEYGEIDQGLRRGNPLKLCTARYKKLENIWLGHLIHEEVSRWLEASHTLTVTQWQHL